MTATLQQQPNGKWRVYRDFESLPAAQNAIGKIAEISEAAFQPARTVYAHVPVAHELAAAAIRDGVLGADVGNPITPIYPEEPALRANPLAEDAE
jgi:hypothetical protein